MKRIAVYYRVSTDMQQTDSQRHAVNEYLLRYPDAELRIYEDLALSGKHTDRPEYQLMLEAVLNKEVDGVVTYALDRISRSSSEAIKTIITWRQAGIRFVPVSQPHLSTDTDNPFQNTILAAYADMSQMERVAIVGRIKNGIAAARQRSGGKWGRRSIVTQELLWQILDLRDTGLSVRDIAEEVGVSKSTVSNVIRAV